MPVRLIAAPRNAAVAWSADLDGDGAQESIIENQRVRAVFSGPDATRWVEYVWKDAGVNVLPEAGAAANRTAKLDGPTLTMEQAAPSVKSTEVNGITLTVEHPTPSTASYR